MKLITHAPCITVHAPCTACASPINALCTLCVLPCTPCAGPMHALCTGHAGPVHTPSNACPVHAQCTPHAHSVNTLCISDACPMHNTFIINAHPVNRCTHPMHALCKPCACPVLQKDGHQPSLRWSPTILMMVTPIQNMVSHLERMVTKLAKDGHQPSSE